MGMTYHLDLNASIAIFYNRWTGPVNELGSGAAKRERDAEKKAVCP